MSRNIYKVFVPIKTMKKTKKLRCPKCKHEWDYKGKSKYYLTCPHCYKKIKVEDSQEVKEDQK